MSTYISTEDLEMERLDAGQEVYLDQIIALDGRDAVVLDEQPVRNGSGRIVGSHMMITREAWEAVQEAIAAAADDVAAASEQQAEEAAQEIALANVLEAVGVLEQWRAQVAAAVQSAGAARTGVEDAQAVRDLAIREAIAAGITGYRLARETGLAESTISRIARR